jgi:adenylyltransferase/sulfurtransferase
MALSNDQIARYARQLIVPELGVRGQERLAHASVGIVGAGGLGSPAALYLAAAGVGRIGLIDADTVEVHNLHRQILHSQADIGRPKTASGSERLRALNPTVMIDPVHQRLSAANAARLLAPYGLILDGSDNIATRYVVNDACILDGKPLIYGGVVHLGGQLMAIQPKVSACLRCVFPEPPLAGDAPSCQEAGVLGAVAGVIGTLMAHEALKWLLELGAPLTDRLLVFEGRASAFREVPVRRDPGCDVCGNAPSIRSLTDEGIGCKDAVHEEESWPGSKSR